MRASDLSTGLLAYYVGTEHVYAVLLDQKGQTQRFSLLSCAEAFPNTDRLLDVLEQPYAWTPSERDKVLTDFSEHWGQRLLPPADALRAFDVLTIVPHHFLHGVPLHIVMCAGEPLAASHGIAYCSSSTLLCRCVERNRARQFDTSAWRFPLGSDGAEPSGPRVTTCLGYGIDVLTDKDAAYRELAETFAKQFQHHAMVSTRTDVKNALIPSHRRPTSDPAQTQPDAICLVCHGYYDAISARKSGMLLAGHRGVVDLRNVRVHGDTVLRVRDHPFAEIPLRLNPVQPQPLPFGTFDPEMFTAAELEVHCQTDAQLIALFGCSTGTGALASSDDYVSQAYQWLKAGAASVVANLWEADFPILMEWTRRFVINWSQRRQPKAIAAREATRSLLADSPGLARQPALWGSVSVLGDWL